jgi:lysophospholipase L1-like esterase
MWPSVPSVGTPGGPLNPSRLAASFVVVTTAALVAACTVDASDGEISAAAAAPMDLPTDNYLALGDSVPFGFNPLLLPSATNPVNPTADQFVGYPEVVAQLAKPIREANVACPGETSTSFLKSLAYVNASAVPLDRGCHLVKQAGVLHVPYVESQLDRAVSFLTTHPQTKLVTLTLGGNDVGLLGDVCAAQVDAGVRAGSIPVAQAAAAVQSCVGSNLNATLGTLAANVTTILSAVRGTGYKGELIVLSYYSLNYNQPFDLLKLANDTVAQAAAPFGVKIASGYDAFKAASGPAGDPCAAGLLIPLPTSPATCDVHPTQKGREILGATVRATMAKNI